MNVFILGSRYYCPIVTMNRIYGQIIAKLNTKSKTVLKLPYTNVMGNYSQKCKYISIPSPHNIQETLEIIINYKISGDHPRSEPRWWRQRWSPKHRFRLFYWFTSPRKLQIINYKLIYRNCRCHKNSMKATGKLWLYERTHTGLVNEYTHRVPVEHTPGCETPRAARRRTPCRSAAPCPRRELWESFVYGTWADLPLRHESHPGTIVR